jgi:hypothetical protein
MQNHRNGAGATASPGRATPPPPVDRVCGLGISDALRVELERCQIDSFADELDERRRVLDETIGATITDGRGDELRRLHYERDVVEMIARQLRGGLDDGWLVVCGPAPLMSQLIAGAAHAAADQLVEALGARPVAAQTIVAVARVATAWAHTFVAKEAVESYSFDPDFDPITP